LRIGNACQTKTLRYLIEQIAEDGPMPARVDGPS